MIESHRYVLPRAKVKLRPIVDGDRPLIFALRRDTALQSLLLTVPAATDEAAFNAWLDRRRNEHGGAFLIVEEVGRSAVGYVQITQVHHRNATGYGGIVLAEEARGRGLGRAALRELGRHAAATLGIRKLMAEIRSDNATSIALHVSLGYREIGILEAHFIDGEGEAHDARLFERLLQEE